MNNWEEMINFNEDKFKLDTDTTNLEDIEVVEEAIQTLKQFYFSKDNGFRREEKVSLLAINLLMNKINNLQSKIDKAIELCNYSFNNPWYISEKELLGKIMNILKVDK